MSTRTQTVKEDIMNSFNVIAVGNLAKNPELAVKGDTTYTRFVLSATTMRARMSTETPARRRRACGS